MQLDLWRRQPHTVHDMPDLVWIHLTALPLQPSDLPNCEDVVCPRRRPAGEARVKRTVPLGMRWPVERTNSWLSNFGQLRRNTDRFIRQRLAQLALAIADIILTVKLVKWVETQGWLSLLAPAAGGPEQSLPLRLVGCETLL